MSERAEAAGNHEHAKRSADLADPVFLTELRAQMLSYALPRLPDAGLAEDAVQEALAGALQNAGSFGRRAALKTWIFAILRHKIADLHRAGKRATAAVSLPEEPDEEGDGVLDTLFDDRGYWRADARPSDWSGPLGTLMSERFWRVFETCLEGLPANQSRIFMMREFLECESGEICESLDISPGNLHTQLFRSRMRLRECLENRWFAGSERP